MRTDPAELRVLRAELLDAHRELVRLRGQTEQLVASNKDLSGLLGASSQRLAELVKIVVAFQQLLDARDVADAWRSLEDIVVNVIGCEDFVVLQLTSPGAYRAVGGRGDVRDRLIGQPVSLDAMVDPLRVIPLCIGENVVGEVVLIALLPHREPLNASDEQVFGLISRFAAPAVMMAEQQRTWVRLTPPSAW